MFIFPHLLNLLVHMQQDPINPIKGFGAFLTDR